MSAALRLSTAGSTLPSIIGGHSMLCPYESKAMKETIMLDRMQLLATRAVIAIFILIKLGPAAKAAASEDYLYRAEMVRAAPGKIVELIDLYKAQAAIAEAGGDAVPFWMRHSQGDQWDLLLLYPMKSYTDYYSAERVTRRKKAEASAPDLAKRIQQDISWQEDVFVYGPAIEAVSAAFADADFYHVEMLHALPGRQADLYHEREMESAYAKAIGRPELFIFVRDQGAAWDVISIDLYRDLQHYAGCTRGGTCDAVPPEKQLAAARAAGFTDANQIGPYLRSVIAYHHDTLAVAVTPAAQK
jgi:hypothetical protein